MTLPALPVGARGAVPPIGARVVVRWRDGPKFRDAKGELLELSPTDVVIATDSKNFDLGTLLAIPICAVHAIKAIPPRPGGRVAFVCGGLG